MLYSFVRPIARLGLKAFYRKIYVSNAERMPRDKPVFLASNHPTAFIEPCLMACFLDRPLFFLVRGNLFQKKIFDQLLRSLNMLPIYRRKDGGYSKVKNNYETFQSVFKALHDDRTVMILIEGSTIQVKRLRPLKKGTARMAFGAIEAYDLEEVYIVPGGVNFTYAERPRSEVMIEIGEPVKARDYLEEYVHNPNRAIMELTNAVKPALEDCLVVVEKPENDEVVEGLLQMHRSAFKAPRFPVVSNDPERFEMEKAVATKVSRADPGLLPELREAVGNYMEHLGQFGLEDRTLVHRGAPPAAWPLWLGFPVFALGYAFNKPLTLPGKRISETRVKTHEFVMPVRWAVSLGMYLLSTLTIIVVTLATQAWWLLPAYLGLLLSGYFALYYLEYRHEYRQHRRLRIVPNRQVEALLKRREEVLGLYNSLKPKLEKA
ncbi:MAG: 1-acyl-sn-glycerol-3-phosphate acyltransferase [Phaeodactylibacter sp.]|uniref:1-acyl-sn-glycerol-3-phosphate acyltransferase n=1 Tax=Phaeodactylibacter sp. TaxID=1940289 RepID=UPI0032ED9ECA